MSNSRIEAEAVIRKELGPNEYMLWAGQPRGGVRFRPSDALFMPFSLMWGGFAIFWEYLVVTKGAPLFFTLWGVPFVLVGLYTIVGRFLVDARRRDTTYYGLTNERVIIVSGLFGRTSKSLGLRALSDVSLQEQRDKSGTVSFGPFSLMAGWLNSKSAWSGIPMVPCLEFIENARDVYDKIRNAQQEARGGSGKNEAVDTGRGSAW